MVDGFVEGCAEGEVEERRRELVNETVEVPSKGEMGERGRQVVHRVIKRDPKGEPGESGGEIIHALVEAESEGQLKERLASVALKESSKMMVLVFAGMIDFECAITFSAWMVLNT